MMSLTSRLSLPSPSHNPSIPSVQQTSPGTRLTGSGRGTLRNSLCHGHVAGESSSGGHRGPPQVAELQSRSLRSRAAMFGGGCDIVGTRVLCISSPAEGRLADCHAARAAEATISARRRHSWRGGGCRRSALFSEQTGAGPDIADSDSAAGVTCRCWCHLLSGDTNRPG